jgi:cell division protein ZapA
MKSGTVKVSILGQSYNIKGDTSPEYILELTDYVNKKIEDISGNVTSGNALHIAILAALNIADEFFQNKRITDGIEGILEYKTKELITLLDEGIIGDKFSGTDSNLMV